MLAVLHTRHHSLLRGGIAGQLVRDHHARCPALTLQQFAQQALGRLRVAPALNQDVEHDSMLVHGTPEPMLFTSDADHNVIEMPFVARSRTTPADLVGKILAELHRPLPYRLAVIRIPRAASISSTMRRLKGNRKYSHTTWLMTSAGNRWRA